MRENEQGLRIPESAVSEFAEVEKMDWSEGISLEELLEWVNEVTARFRPPEVGEGSRVGAEFSMRTFRHYQTMGCIDVPARAGQRVVYRFRHYVQALLLRKLLWERLPAEKIAELMKGLSTEECKRLLFEGIEVFGEMRSLEEGGDAPRWRRFTCAEGVEIHLRDDVTTMSDQELRDMVELFRAIIRDRIR